MIYLFYLSLIGISSSNHQYVNSRLRIVGSLCWFLNIAVFLGHHLLWGWPVSLSLFLSLHFTWQRLLVRDTFPLSQGRLDTSTYISTEAHFSLAWEANYIILCGKQTYLYISLYFPLGLGRVSMWLMSYDSCDCSSVINHRPKIHQ